MGKTVTNWRHKHLIEDIKKLAGSFGAIKFFKGQHPSKAIASRET
ncbi:hypothetical protein CCACVL1_19929, partial [Corchorus capsularis]